MDSFAVFFDLWPTVPTYHGFNQDRLNEREEPGVSSDWTRCGRLVCEYRGGRLREPGKWIPLKHAEKFAKPCRICFRGEA